MTLAGQASSLIFVYDGGCFPLCRAWGTLVQYFSGFMKWIPQKIPMR